MNEERTHSSSPHGDKNPDPKEKFLKFVWYCRYKSSSSLRGASTRRLLVVVACLPGGHGAFKHAPVPTSPGGGNMVLTKEGSW